MAKTDTTAPDWVHEMTDSVRHARTIELQAKLIRFLETELERHKVEQPAVGYDNYLAGRNAGYRQLIENIKYFGLGNL